MNIEFLTDDSELFLCDRYKLTEIESTEELLSFHQKLTDEHPDFSFLLTIDDVNQAAYTSMHSRLKHKLGRLDGHDLSGLPKRCYEDGKHIGYLQTKEEFWIRRANFLADPEVSIDVIDEKFLALTEESFEEFLTANDDLLSVCDATMYCLKVPVQKSHELICAFPNGYFSGDLTPFENFAVAKYLEEEFGYKLVGSGASYLAFKREEALDSQSLETLHDWLLKIHWDGDVEDFDEAFFSDFIRRILSTRRTLVFRYSE